VAEGSAIGRLREQRRAELGRARPDTRTAILDAVGRQLEIAVLHDLSVEQVLADAGVSRRSFYSYFESKYEAAGALVAVLMDEMYDLWTPYLDRSSDEETPVVFRAVLTDAVALWRENRGIARAIHQYWTSVPEIGDHWIASMERFTEGVAAGLDREREAGRAPQGADSRELAATALWATEHLLFVSGTGQSSDLPDEEGMLDPLLTLWAGLMYGGAVKDSPSV
jgi:TetR/AcrR family transcriptional regulator, ethionamide resistance regulator